MSSVKARKYVVRSQFAGTPKREDLEIVEEELPPLKDGGKYSDNCKGGEYVVYKIQKNEHCMRVGYVY